MHKIEKTPKIVTIIGLVLEGIGVTAAVGMGFLFKALFSNASTTAEFRDSLMEEDMTFEDADAIIDMITIFADIFLIIGFIALVFFIVNLVLFSKLITGKYTEEQANKVYLYQAIYGGVNLLFNQLVGILYLVAGIQGYNKRPDKIDVREGI